jgi:hypothetical protein
MRRKFIPTLSSLLLSIVPVAALGACAAPEEDAESDVGALSADEVDAVGEDGITNVKRPKNQERYVDVTKTIKHTAHWTCGTFVPTEGGSMYDTSPLVPMHLKLRRGEAYFKDVPAGTANRGRESSVMEFESAKNPKYFSILERLPTMLLNKPNASAERCFLVEYSRSPQSRPSRLQPSVSFEQPGILGISNVCAELSPGKPNLADCLGSKKPST